MKEAVRKFKETVEIQSSIINRIKEHRYFPIGVLFVVFFLAASFHVWQRVRVVTLVQDVKKLKSENAGLLDDKKKLYSDIASLTTSSRIETYARDTLGLYSASSERLVTLVMKDNVNSKKDGLALMYSSLKRVVDYIPVVEQTRANATGPEKIDVDSSLSGIGAK